MQALPCVRVRDLAPSASFYSAVTQPLGLRFISANAGSIVFGNPTPTFEVKATPAGTAAPKPTRIVLSANSPSAVSAFHAAARRANPHGDSHILLKEDDITGGESRASATDLEGNVVEIVYTPPNYSPGYAGSSVSSTVRQSSTRHTTGILGWNLDAATSMVGAARSAVGSAAPSRPGLATLVPPGEDESYRIIRRSFTSSTVETSPPQQENSKGLSSGAVVGTILGATAAAAVGAGLAYAFMKKDRDRAPRQEFDAAPPFQRRATYHPGEQPRYVEMERTVEKVRYPEQYPPEPNNYAQPAYTTRRSSQAPSPPVEEIIEDRAPRQDPPPRIRERSVDPPEKTLLITETEHKSTVGTEIPIPPPPPPPPMPPTVSEDDQEPKPPNKSALHAELFKRTNRCPSEAPSKTPSKARSRAPEDKDRDKDKDRDDDARSHVSSRSRHHHHHRHGHHHRHHDRDRERERDRDRDRERERERDRDRDRDDDRRSHTSSRHRRTRDAEAETYVSARSEKSTTSTVRAPTDIKPPRSKAPSRAPSYVSAREIPSPPKEADWKDLVDDDDDKVSVAPSDSISCVGEERPKPHARDLPFLQTRERIIIQ
ncbi:hypothetical protein GGR51DRAFT_420471 [Nemania sp. FL0031]|nr:hypothetical protein GGR51DRAFT_420471 [Nemania sp. FL0031]